MTDELASSSLMKTDFISNVSHEMKTPLAVINNYGMLLQADVLSDKDRKEYARTITAASRRMSELITIEKLVVKTAVPMVVAQVINMLYNIVDRVFVGKIPEVGAVALGGIGVYLPINILLMAVSLLFGAGGAPQAAIAMGAGDRKKAESHPLSVFP